MPRYHHKTCYSNQGHLTTVKLWYRQRYPPSALLTFLPCRSLSGWTIILGSLVHLLLLHSLCERLENSDTTASLTGCSFCPSLCQIILTLQLQWPFFLPQSLSDNSDTTASMTVLSAPVSVRELWHYSFTDWLFFLSRSLSLENSDTTASVAVLSAPVSVREVRHYSFSDRSFCPSFCQRTLTLQLLWPFFHPHSLSENSDTTASVNIFPAPFSVRELWHYSFSEHFFCPIPVSYTHLTLPTMAVV